MDWDVLSSIDILALFKGLCTGEQTITKVVVYPSLFGLEQMKKDTLYGPPKEIFQKIDPQKSKKKKKYVDNDSDSDDVDDMYAAFKKQEDQNEDLHTYHQQKLRKYEV